jgi:predicted SpoU family rRNA methylase
VPGEAVSLARRVFLSFRHKSRSSSFDGRAVITKIPGQSLAKRIIEKSGAWQGFTCHIARYPDENLTIAVFTNLQDAKPSMIAHVSAGLVEPALMPTKFSVTADNDPSIAAALRTLLEQVATGADIRQQLTTDFAATIPADASKRMKRIQKRIAPVWPGSTLTLVNRQPHADLPGASTFRLTRGTESILIHFSRDAAGKISDLGLTPDRPYE